MKATIKHGAAFATAVFGLGILAVGCLTRPVEHADPVTKTNVTIQVPNQAVDKIDMLFDIDNSASMGDKQQYLTEAIPELIARLVTPNCVDTSTPPVVNGTVDANGMCPAGFKAEFPAVHDMHIGVVTSSLGTRLSDQSVNGGAVSAVPTGYVLCNPNAVTAEYNTLNAHNDDKGELITRSEANGADGTVGDAAGSGYLYYFPSGTTTDPQKPVTLAATLESDFSSLVNGAGIYGCGIESQLESWYRFLIQPDPYGSLALNPTTGAAGWSGLDSTIIQQRHDFLRPDSLVVVVVLTDENDSEIDVRSLSGTGYLFMHEQFTPPHGTSACATTPDNPKACYNCSAGNQDPNCTANNGVYTATNDWGFDANLRHVHMLQKYGVDPQYPIGRYYVGLQSTLVPNRDGEYPAGAGQYVGNATCTNPLFASALPDGTVTNAADLCNLPVGPRANQKTNIFYAHIGGVPYQLLHFNPTDLTASELQPKDWIRILGQGTAAFASSAGATALTHDYTGIDPHMIESYLDRTTDPLYTSGAVDKTVTDIAPSTASNTADKVSGREWVTDQPAPTGAMDAQGLPIGHVLPVDRQYACTFKLAAARDCTQTANANSCDCPADATGLTPAQIPPLCDPNNPTSQIYAKAYPTIRELTLADLMQGQGIVASLCPQDTTPAAGSTAQTDPLYGYNPAVAVIVDRLKAALNSPCIPEKLGAAGDAGGGSAVPCLVLVELPASVGGSCTVPVCDNTKGLFGPGQATGSAGNPPLDQTVLNSFCETQENKYIAGGNKAGLPGDPALQSFCMMYQLTPADGITGEFNNGTCSGYDPPNNATAPGNGGGWCYVTGPAAGACTQAIQFDSKSPPSGSVTFLQCIEESISVVTASSASSM